MFSFRSNGKEKKNVTILCSYVSLPFDSFRLTGLNKQATHCTSVGRRTCNVLYLRYDPRSFISCTKKILGYKRK